MKNSSHSTLDKPISCHPRGFALVATLLLMVLLSLLAVGMLTLSTVTIRSSSRLDSMAEARANAKMALMIAIGELQKEMGPDKRISAKAAILDTDPATEEVDDVIHPNYLGVWDSWDTWLTDSKGRLSIQATYDRGRERDPSDPRLFRRWLVSGPATEEFNVATDNFEDIEDLSLVKLVGQGSAGPDISKHIEVPLVTVSDGGNTTGNYAWWISDESQKVRLDMEARAEVNNFVKAEIASTQTGRMGVEKMDGMTGFDTSPESLERMITTSQAGISVPESTEHFHDITAYSLGLLVDVRSGGFKSDLNLAFESEDMPEQMNEVTQFGKAFDAPIRPMTGNISNITPENPYIGPVSWRQLREFYRIYRSDFADSATRQPMVWDSGKPATNRFLVGKKDLFQWDTMGYAREPVMLRQTWVLATSSQNDASLPGGIDYYLLAIPVITLWNPYNVRLIVEPREIAYLSAIYAAMNLRQIVYRDGVLVDESDMPDEKARPSYWGNNSNPNGIITNNQTGFRMKIAESGSGPVIFEPGEVRVFSTDDQITNFGGATQANENNRFFVATPGYKPIQDTNAGVLRGLKYRIYPGEGPGQPELALGFLRTPIKDATPGIDMRSPPGSTTSLLAAARSAPIIWNFQDGYENDSKVLFEDGSTVDRDYLLNNAESYWDMAWTGFTSLNWIDQSDVNSLGWIVPNTPSTRATWGAPGSPPSPIGMVSIVAKSPQELSYETSGDFTEDFRNRGWLHAPATRRSNYLMTPSDLARADSAYQLHFLPVNGDFEIANYLEADGPLGYYGGGYSANNGETHVTALSLPTSPTTSLGSLSGMRINHGRTREVEPVGGRPIWRRYTRNKVSAHPAGAFGVGVGNSYAHPMITATQVYKQNDMGTDNQAGYFQRSGDWLGTGLKVCDDYWDHLFLANEELWDSWFFSGITPEVSNGEITTTQKDVATQFFSNEETNISTHFQPYLGGKTVEDLADLVEATDEPYGDNGWDLVASHMLNRGQFNVNSTSKQAWKALLMSLSNRPIAANEVSSGTSYISPDEDQVTLSRFPLANSKTEANGPDDEDAWNGIRKLTVTQIDKLAEEVVRQVKLRGPFLNMTEFINRRLSSDEMGVTGALQAAIDWDEFNAGYDGTTSGSGESINQAYKGSGDMIISSSLPASYPNEKAALGSRYAGIPGYVIQSDLLQGLSTSLSVRGDTFLIRAYGESLTQDGSSVAASAWCEAVIQRYPDYVDPADAADKKIRQNNQLPSIGNSLSSRNVTFGRQFKIVTFRWLNKNEV